MAEPDLVTLKGGLVVPVHVLRRLWTLEDGGLQIHLADDGADLLVGPPSKLSDETRAFLRQHKPMILHLLTAYEVTG